MSPYYSGLKLGFSYSRNFSLFRVKLRPTHRNPFKVLERHGEEVEITLVKVIDSTTFSSQTVSQTVLFRKVSYRNSVTSTPWVSDLYSSTDLLNLNPYLSSVSNFISPFVVTLTVTRPEKRTK